MAHIPFGASIDPHGYLESMVKHGYVHGEDNVVEYYTQDVGGGNSFSKAKPQVFRVGDLVDVQVSFVVVELRQQMFKMVPVLHTIALVDGNFTQMARRKRQGSGATSANSVQTTLKRRVGYGTITREQEKKGHTMQLDG
ncbi:hypothetical protein BD779DRAFT_1671044 [Infundibulicybe gibba]|nr:hypothetical protein BD779DRAFT_1671044 [Infundibulicybe gibba]